MLHFSPFNLMLSVYLVRQFRDVNVSLTMFKLKSVLDRESFANKVVQDQTAPVAPVTGAV